MKIAVIFDSLHPEWDDAAFKREVEQKAEEAEYDVARALLAGGHQRITVAYDVAALVLNVALNLTLIPNFGYIGAAITAVLTSLFVAACSWTAAARWLDVRGEAPLRVVGVVIANAVFAVTLVLGATVLPLWAVVPLAFIAYPVWLLLSRAVTRAEIALLLPHRSVAALTEPS